MSTEGSAGWVRDRTEAKEAEEKTARPLLCEERPVSLPRCAIGRCEKRCSDLASHRSSPRGTGGRKTRGCGRKGSRKEEENDALLDTTQSEIVGGVKD